MLLFLFFFFFFSFYIKRNLFQNSCGFYASSLLFSLQLSAVRCVAVAPLWYRFARPHRASGLLAQAEHASRHLCSPFSVLLRSAGDRWQFPCTCHLLPSPGAREGVLSQWDGGGAGKAECHPCSTRFPRQWDSLGFLCQGGESQPWRLQSDGAPGSPSWSDERRTGSTASAS